MNCSNAWPDVRRGCESSDGAAYFNAPSLKYTKMQQCIKQQQDKGQCGEYLNHMRTTFRGYARGVFYPLKDAVPSWMPVAESLKTSDTAGLAYSRGGWELMVNCTGGSKKSCKPLGNVPWHASCMFKPSDARPADPSLANMLVILAVAIYAQEEARRAAWLGYVAAALAGILPSFYHKPGVTTPRPVTYFAKGSVGWPFCLLALTAPLVQFLVVLFLLLSSAALSLVQEAQTSILSIVVNAVALTFILELDNKVGAVLLAQQKHWDKMQQAGRDSTNDVDQQPSDVQQSLVWRKCAGHMYFSVLGAMMFGQVLCMSPALAAVVLLFSENPWDYSNGGLWSAWVASASCMLLVFLLFGQPVPTVAKRWPPTLLAMLCLSIGTCVWIVASSMILFFITAMVIPGVWFGMFVVWPTCHRWQQPPQQRSPTVSPDPIQGIQRFPLLSASIGRSSDVEMQGVFGLDQSSRGADARPGGPANDGQALGVTHSKTL